MNKMLFTILVISLFTLFSGCTDDEGVTSMVEPIRIEIKQIIPLPTATFIEVIVPLNTTKGFEWFESTYKGNKEIEEEKEFAIVVKIENPEATYYDTKLSLTYNEKYISFMHPYRGDKTPMKKISENRFSFDKELLSGATNVLLIGKTNRLDASFVGAEYSISILDRGGSVLSTESDTMKIVKSRE